MHRIAAEAILIVGARQMANGEQKKDRYRDTLQLPSTSFSMRAGLVRKEPELQARWAEMDLYQRMLEQPHPQGPYVFHDGPPYANGTIHMGHLLNKILKDMVVRSRTMAGHEVRFIPGWDCHGLPIEHKVLKEIGADSINLNTMEIRRKCHDYAVHYQKVQAEQMLRLGTIGDYKDPYLTMAPAMEGATLEVFATLVGHGLVYRDLKPVHWSIENRTALADAELEYYDREDSSIYVFFEVVDPGLLPSSLGAPAGERVDLMIWTTTPWTLPANKTVAVAEAAEYALCRIDHDGTSRLAIVAADLREAVFGGSVETLGRCRGSELVSSGVTYRHPFIDQQSRLVLADYVTLEDGSGLVHTAPGHGAEDYETGLREGIEIYCPVQEDGTFDETAPEWLQGLDVWQANPLVIERLVSSGHMYRHEPYLHSYPHDWRGKTPTIFRATEQWFISVDTEFGDEARSLRRRALDATDRGIEFVPGWGQNRMRGMLESRPDWCISRQRSWGLPIPAFFVEGGGLLLTEASVRAVARFVREHGSDAWFTSTPEDILQHYDPASDADLSDSGPNVDFAALTKGADIFDVWFESGSTWNGCIRERGIRYPCDLYLEGSDQHRGWFQTSLLAGLGMTGQSPYKTVLTHGFVVTAQGQKMSKSLGNAIEVEDLLKQYGADVCRWWTATLNYNYDVKVDWDFFKVASDEYRKVRNTVRFMLGNLADFDPERDRYAFGEGDRLSVDWWAMARLARLIGEVKQAYLKFQYKRVTESIFDFCNDCMSAVYLAAVKDRLYCDAADGPRRRRTQTVLYDTVRAVIRMLAPILVHTADEAWQALNGDGDGSVHLEYLPEPFDWADDAAWTKVLEIRAEALKALELAKQEPGISNPMDAGIVAVLPAGEIETVRPFAAELVDLCGVSRFSIEAGDARKIRVADLRDEPRCERSWKRDGTVRERSDGGLLSDRDAEVLGLK